MFMYVYMCLCVCMCVCVCVCVSSTVLGLEVARDGVADLVGPGVLADAEARLVRHRHRLTHVPLSTLIGFNHFT